MKTPTFKDLVEFVIVNKKDKVFLGYDYDTIVRMLLQGVRDDCLFYLVDTQGKLVGMVLAEKVVGSDTLLVTENLAMSLKNLKELAKIGKQRWPNLKLEWIKHGNRKSYNQNKVYNKLKV